MPAKWALSWWFVEWAKGEATPDRVPQSGVVRASRLMAWERLPVVLRLGSLSVSVTDEVR